MAAGDRDLVMVRQFPVRAFGAVSCVVIVHRLNQVVVRDRSLRNRYPNIHGLVRAGLNFDTQGIP